jgi:hypothetical protein
LLVSPTSLTFGNQSVGTISPAQVVSVTNLGGATVTIAGISIGSGFAETNNCGSALVAHGVCSISVTFSPTGAGPQSGSMTLTDNATNSPQVVTLTGKGNNGKGH